MTATLNKSEVNLPDITSVYNGKVRDVYSVGNDLIVMVVSDRISAFDVVLPEGIPYKGIVLNQIAARNLRNTRHIVPNWLLETPDPAVSVGIRCTPFKVEMVVRGYLAGHAWREYSKGKRVLCGVSLPEGLRENDKLPAPIITPTTKADVGHDEDISREEIIRSNLVSESDYRLLEKYALELFGYGTKESAKQGLILVDTKYEFGKSGDGNIMLIDEVHTPDSSRYFYSDGYEERQSKGTPQRQLSKEFVRQWLISNGFEGKDGQSVPKMESAFINSVSERYLELYGKICGEKLALPDSGNPSQRIQSNIDRYFNSVTHV